MTYISVVRGIPKIVQTVIIQCFEIYGIFLMRMLSSYCFGHGSSEAKIMIKDSAALTSLKYDI